ncbi:extracellular solute-binding protein [Alphaproteobacteria bacterium]|nr:extracellular solute-binding protein [Alphaproteobacteria bacterium]
MKLKTLVSTMASVLLISSQAAYADKWGDQFPHIAATGDIPGMCSYEEMSKKDYSGRTLTINTHAIPVMGEPTALHAEQFEKLTGAKVEVTHTPAGDLYSKAMVPFQAGQAPYDIVFGFSNFINEWKRYLAPVPQKYVDQMTDVTASHIAIASWGDTMYQYPVDGDRHYLKYRKDVIDNPEMQAKYKADTGNDLRVPQTWKEYAEMAAYFNGWDWDGDGEPEYGSAEVMKKDDLMYAAFYSRSAAYSKNPSTPGGFFFDLETMKPLINNPGFVEALTDWVEAVSYVPPGGINFGLGDEINSFGGGQTLFSFSWDDAFVAAMQDDSPIKDQVGAAQLPGATKVWNRETNSWDEGFNQAPFFVWGWAVGVADKSKNQDVAFDYLCFFANGANHQADIGIGRFGVNPFMEADFEAEVWTDIGWDAQVAQEYVDTLADMEKSTNRVFPLRVPGTFQFNSALATGTAKALAGQLSPQEALDEVAAEWEAILERVGADNVRDAYAIGVAMEDNEL